MLSVVFAGLFLHSVDKNKIFFFNVFCSFVRLKGEVGMMMMIIVIIISLGNILKDRTWVNGASRVSHVFVWLEPSPASKRNFILGACFCKVF